MNSKLTSIFKKTLPYLLPAIVLSAAVIYFFNNFDQFRQIKISSWWWLVGLATSCLGQSFTGALVFKKILKIFEIRLGLWEAIGLVYVTGMGNYLIPYVGGIGLRATYLKKKYGFSLGYFVSTVGGVALLSISINALIGLMVLLYLLVIKGFFSVTLFFVFFICLLFPASLIFLPPRKFKTNNRLLRKVSRIWEGWGVISCHSGDVVILSFLILLTAVSGVLILYFSFRVVSESIALADVLIISATTALSALVNITPSGLGITELAVVFSSRALGYVVVISVSVALIRRIVATVIIFAGGIISSYVLSKSVVSSGEMDHNSP